VKYHACAALNRFYGGPAANENSFHASAISGPMLTPDMSNRSQARLVYFLNLPLRELYWVTTIVNSSKYIGSFARRRSAYIGGCAEFGDILIPITIGGLSYPSHWIAKLVHSASFT
jgi:hypothetical protein